SSVAVEVSNQTMSFMSPTKTLNIAGLQISYVITENKSMHTKLATELSRQGMNMINTIGVVALDAVYPDGNAWLDQLLNVIEANKNYVVKRLEAETPIKVIDADGTSLL